VVIGAGASGLWTALELARDHEVLVCEADRVGDGASGSATGFVSAFEDWAAYPAAVEHAIDRFRWLDGRHGFEFVDRPYVELIEDSETAADLRDAYAPLIERDGYAIEYFHADELAARWPDRFDLTGFDGGLVNEESGIIRPQSYVDSLAAAVRNCGVEIREETPVERVRHEAGAVAGVRTPEGEIDAETVVCAAGAQTARLVDPFVDVPTRQFVYMNVRVDATELPADYPMMYGRDLWWRPSLDEAETMLVSGGMYFLDEPDTPPGSPPTEYRNEIVETLPMMAKDVSDPEILADSYQTCPKGSAITPDALPIIDEPAAGPDGLVVVAGVTAGISMSPFTGRAVRSLVTGDRAPVPLDDFRLDRFGDPPEQFQVHGIRDLPTG